MNYKLFGQSGLRVSELCLGTMTFGEEWGIGAGKEESKKIFDRFTGEGGNFIDTANAYNDGTSEKYVGEFIAGDRDHFVVATKYTLSMRKGDPNFSGNHRKNMVQSLEASLKRLNTEYIDLFWLHAWDYFTPVEEILRGMDDLVRAGKVLYAGISDTPAWIISHANTLARMRGWTQFTGLQVEYSLIERTVERELLPMARGFGMSVTPWAVMGGGMLSGKYNPGEKSKSHKRMKPDSLRMSERNFAIAEEVVNIADETGHDPVWIAINWVRQQDNNIIPLIGARSEKQLKSNLKCLDFTLDQETIRKLDAVSAIELGFPHEFLDRDVIRNRVYGGTFNDISF